MSARKLDIYNHVLPAAFIARMRELAPEKGDIVKRVTSIALLHDIEARIRMMEQWPGYQQVLTLANPHIEAMAGPSDALGWPYETSVAMARIVFSGLFDRLPRLAIVTHHLGASAARCSPRRRCASPVGPRVGRRGLRKRGSLRMAQRPIEYFHRFYGDTAVCGSRAAISCGLNFFGPDRVLFASDCPFDPEGGPMFVRETIAAIDALDIPEEDRRKIYCRNALRLMRVPGHEH